MGFQSFKELRVWQEGKKLAVDVYKVISESKLSKDFILKDQMQRAAISIPSNIAEGYERNTNKEFIRFLYISLGSLSELETQLEISKDIGYINDETLNSLEDKCKKIRAMILNLIKSRQ